MKFTEIDTVNLTKQMKSARKINVPLSQIVTNSIPPEPAFSEKQINTLDENGISTTEQFRFAYKRGTIENIKGFGKSTVKNLYDTIEQNISQIPGISKEIYSTLIQKGIKNIKQFNLAYQENRLQMATPEEDDKIENVKMTLERNSQPSLMRVYHSSADIHCAEYIIDQVWSDGPNSQAYGTGLYTCWTESSSFDDMDVYGRKLACPKQYYYESPKQQGRMVYVTADANAPVLFRFEFLVDVQNYFIFNYEVYKNTHPNSHATEHDFIEEQNKKFGTNYHSAQGDFWGFWWKDKRSNPNFPYSSNEKTKIVDPKTPCIQGVIFNGGHDGDVVVCYNTKLAIPTRMSLGDKHVWYPIGDKSYSSLAMQTAMGIVPYGKFIEKFKNIIHKDLDEILKDYNGANDMEATEFVNTNGKSYIISNSDEDGTLEAPEANEYDSSTDIFGQFEIRDCLHAKHINMPFKEVDTFIIDNKTDPELESIGSYNNVELKVNKTFIVNRAPKIVVPWTKVYCPTKDGNLKVRRTDLGRNFICNGFNKAYFIGVTAGASFGTVDCKNVLVKNVEANEFHLVLDEFDEIESVTIESSKINKIVINSTKEERTIKSFVLKNNSKIKEVSFNIKTEESDTIYKDDISSRNVSYTFEELVDLSKNTGEFPEEDGTTLIRDDIADETGIYMPNIVIE